MTVKELIEKLKQYDENLEVVGVNDLTLEEAMDIIKENSQKEPKNYWDLPKTPENSAKRLKLAMDAKVQYEHYKIYKRFCPYNIKPLTYKVWLDIVIN